MKILATITGMTSGGAERVMATLCNELSNNNKVRLCIIKNDNSDYYISNHVDVKSGNVKHKNIFKSTLFLRKQIEDFKPDIVLSFMTKTNIIALISMQKSKYKCPVVISERANPYYTKGILSYVRQRLYPLADGCVFQTKQAQDYYSKILKCNSVVIRNPLSKDFAIEPFRGKRTKRIVCTARLSPEKNQQLLINSFAKIKEKYNDYILEIYGEGPDREKLEHLVKKLNLEDRVKLMGRRKDIIDATKDAGIFVLPSNSEGMPNSLLEAMSLGIPSIATNCPIGGSELIISNYKNGILIPMNDSRALVEAITKLIDDNKFAQMISEEGTKVKDDFNCDKVCKEWENYLLKIKGDWLQ